MQVPCKCDFVEVFIQCLEPTALASKLEERNQKETNYQLKLETNQQKNINAETSKITNQLLNIKTSEIKDSDCC